MTIQTRTVPAMRLAGVRHEGPCPEIGPAFGTLQQILASGPYWDRSGAWYGVYPAAITDPMDATNVSFAACVLDGDLVEGLEWVDLPEATCFVYTHAGPYEGLPQAWRAAYDALAAAGHAAKPGAALEAYLNDPGDTAPEDLRTEILIPV